MPKQNRTAAKADDNCTRGPTLPEAGVMAPAGIRDSTQDYWFAVFDPFDKIQVEVATAGRYLRESMDAAAPSARTALRH